MCWFGPTLVWLTDIVLSFDFRSFSCFIHNKRYLHLGVKSNVRAQLVVAALSPWVGRRAEIWGRRPLLLIGFAALPIRGLLFAGVASPDLLLAVQLLDGITAAVFAVMVPLVVADLTRGTGHFNLGQGILGTATGIGASLSTTLAGYVTDRFGSSAAFAALAAIAFVGLVTLWRLMPETRPDDGAE